MSRLSKRQTARGARIQNLIMESLAWQGDKEKLEEWAKNLSQSDIKALNNLYKQLPNK